LNCIFRGSIQSGEMEEINAWLWSTLGYSKLRWNHWWKTCSHTVP